MRIRPPRVTAPGGFTLWECLMIAAVLVILIVLLLPLLAERQKPRTILCLNNQRQILIAESLWRDDYGGTNRWTAFMDTAMAVGGANSNVAAEYFQPLLGSYVKSPAVLLCYSDKSRQSCELGTELATSNLSYFAHLTAATSPPFRTVLIGDRHLQANGVAFKTGLNAIPDQATLAWTSELHRLTKDSGVLGFLDGHAVLRNSKSLDQLLDKPAAATNLLAIP